MLPVDPPARVPADAIGTYEFDAVEDTWIWSPTVYAMHGLDPSVSVTTPTILDRIHPDDRESAHQRFQEHLRAEGPYSCQYRSVTASGKVRTLVYIGEAVADDGRVGRLAGFVLDRTDPLRQNATAAIAAAVEHRAAIEQAKGALMLTYGVTDEVAFALIRGFSNNHNITIASLASHLMERLSASEHRDLDGRDALVAILGDLERSLGAQPGGGTAADVVTPPGDDPRGGLPEDADDLDDAALRADIELLGLVIAATAQAKDHLASSEIDALLGLPRRSEGGPPANRVPQPHGMPYGVD